MAHCRHGVSSTLAYRVRVVVRAGEKPITYAYESRHAAMRAGETWGDCGVHNVTVARITRGYPCGEIIWSSHRVRVRELFNGLDLANVSAAAKAEAWK